MRTTPKGHGALALWGSSSRGGRDARNQSGPAGRPERSADPASCPQQPGTVIYSLGSPYLLTFSPDQRSNVISISPAAHCEQTPLCAASRRACWKQDVDCGSSGWIQSHVSGGRWGAATGGRGRCHNFSCCLASRVANVLDYSGQQFYLQCRTPQPASAPMAGGCPF